MDKLEEHIRVNREDLDRHRPSSAIWNRIKKGLGKEKLPINQLFSIAAMIIVILATAIVFLRPGNRPSDINNGYSAGTGLSQTKPQLKETEIYYNNVVNSLYREATPLLTRNPVIKKELNADISQLDSICSEIRKDLKDNVANQEVVEALIQNYRIKIRLLEDMLSILKEIEKNPEKNKSYEL
jgi:hypothetical protein